jgi:NADPH:quinone reductase-like Zn-dependent oxidoreductase
MKEAIVQTDLSVQIVDSPIPTPNADQVLIKVAVSGCNPKDWYAQAQPSSLDADKHSQKETTSQG